MVVDLQTIIDVYKEYMIETNEWLDTHSLVKLPEFKQLGNKDIWGESYRLDQLYYESVSEIKDKAYGVKRLLLDIIADSYTNATSKGLRIRAEKQLEIVENDLWRIDGILTKARTRIKFYEQISYVIGNVTYGAY